MIAHLKISFVHLLSVVVLVRHRSEDVMLFCNILDMAVFVSFEDSLFLGHRCGGGGALVEALVI